MSFDVRPMTDEEYETWMPFARDAYAAQMIEHAGYAEAAARAKAERDFATLLPSGIDTEGQWLYALVDDGEPVGDLWLAERDSDLGKTLFIYDVNVHEDRRGQGLGRAAMLFVEKEAARRGIHEVTLNVFGGNEVARRLYRSLGYREAAVWMAKNV